GPEKRVEEVLEHRRGDRKARVRPRLVDRVKAEEQPPRPAHGVEAASHRSRHDLDCRRRLGRHGQTRGTLPCSSRERGGMTTMRQHAVRLRRSRRMPYRAIRTWLPTMLAVALLAFVLATR